MKNKEKHLKEIVEIACDGNCIAVLVLCLTYIPTVLI